MRKGVFVAGIMLLAFCFGLEAFAQQVQTKTITKKHSVEKQRIVTAQATVEAIDLMDRIVTLKGPKGDIFVTSVGEEVKNLPEVKVGDKVTVKYYEAIAARVLRPGESGVIIGESGEAATAKPWEKPGGMTGRVISILAKVEAIDKKKPSIILVGLDGKRVKVRVENPKNLKKLKVGDDVEITYTEAVAISVKPAEKK